MQMTVKGCPLYFQMIGPRPDGQNQGPIIQSVPWSPSPVKFAIIGALYMCVTFPVCIIRFGAHVSGGDTVSRSLRINNPTMFGKYNHEN